MAQRGRPGLSPEQKRELWSRWKAGESLSEIGRALGKQPGSIHGVVASNGGYVPAVRRRSPRVLTISEREEISRGLAEGASLRRIAGRLHRAPSSISREVARHGGRHRYRAARAEQRAWDRARRPKPCKLAAVPRLGERSVLSDRSSKPSAAHCPPDGKSQFPIFPPMPKASRPGLHLGKFSTQSPQSCRH